MIPVDEATRLIRDTTRVLPTETVALADAGGRILRSPVVADRDVPPFDRVMMDGIALAYSALHSGRSHFRVQGEIAAGYPPVPLADPAHDCLQVMTGAVLPPGCDCVIPVERIELRDGEAIAHKDVECRPGQYIHRQGTDCSQGAPLLHPGGRLNAARIGIAASAGCAELTVSRRPVIGIVSNGDELVDVGLPVESHQIRLSNRYALRAALLQQGLDDLHILHLPDDRAVIHRELETLLDICDVTILSGGVSVGSHDYIPAVLQDLGVSQVFHKIRQRPGKPMWFGLTPADRPVFALPGNPVSTFICFHRYVLPHLDRMLEAEARTRTAVLHQAMTYAPTFTALLPVREIDTGNGNRTVAPVPYHGSGDLTCLNQGTGFVELAGDRSEFPAGAVVPYFPWT